VSYSVLSRTAKLGIAAETTIGTYTAPVFTVTFGAGTRWRDAITQLHDRTARGTDTDIQDIQQGPYWTDWTIESAGYTDWFGFLARAMVGPDTFTAGTSTTFATRALPGAQSVTLNAAPAAGATVMLGQGPATEWVTCGTPTGSGPYTVPVTSPASGVRYLHPAGEPAQSLAGHVFEQDRTYGIAWPSYSLTTDDGVEQLGWPGCVLGRLRLRIGASGQATVTSTWNGFPPAAAPTFTEAQTAAPYPQGWTWGITTAGGTSTRGVSLDLTLTRPLQVNPACDGYQRPLGIFAGPLRVSGRYQAIFDTPADLNLYRQAIQEPAVWTITQPPLQGGGSIQVTLALSGWTAGQVSLDGDYVTAGYSLTGITNTTDSPSGGVSSVTVANYWNQAY
jgi:hypothetical protein